MELANDYIKQFGRKIIQHNAITCKGVNMNYLPFGCDEIHVHIDHEIALVKNGLYSLEFSLTKEDMVNGKMAKFEKIPTYTFFIRDLAKMLYGILERNQLPI